jgi:hypothetical protein
VICVDCERESGGNRTCMLGEYCTGAGDSECDEAAEVDVVVVGGVL